MKVKGLLGGMSVWSQALLMFAEKSRALLHVASVGERLWKVSLIRGAEASGKQFLFMPGFPQQNWHGCWLGEA